MARYPGSSHKMTDWLSKLEQLDIPDGAVAGLSNADKPTIEGKLLQLSAGDRPLFFRGQLIDVLKRLRTLLPDTPADAQNDAAWRFEVTESLEALRNQPSNELANIDTVDAETNETPVRSLKVSRNHQGKLFLDGIEKALANRGLVLLGIGEDGFPAHKDGWTIKTFSTSPVQLIVGPKPGTSDEVLLALVEIKSLLQVHSVLQLDRFTYTEGKVTRKNDPLAQLFSRNVKVEYGALQGNKCWCLLTNAILPSSTVIGSHLFKWEWSEYVHLLGFEDINDVKNGLPLWKPIEWAFDTSRLCFTFDKTFDKFIAKIMDPSILTNKLVDIGQQKMGTDWKRPPFPLQNLTFQDIDNRALEFDPGRPLRPYKRVLNFQARQARTYAIRRGWQPASWDFEDYLTEGMDLSERLKIWYNSMH